MSPKLIAIAFATALLTTTAQATEHHHEHAHPADTPLRLTLNHGQKWPTDAPLRHGMAHIRTAMAAAHTQIHDNRLPRSGYLALARKVEREIAGIVAGCALPPEADAQLHLVIAELSAGAEAMAGKERKSRPRDGAIQVIGALEQYAGHFDHPGWDSPAH